jgi:glycosyltransferase involved in cell wall biosynthesis
MLSYYFPPSYSGSATQALNLARRLARHGVVSRFVSANLTDSAPCEVVDAVPVRRLRVARNSDLRITSFWLALAWSLFRERSSIDIIHAHGATQHTIAAIVGRFLGKPTILKIAMANSDLAFEKQGRLWGRINRFLVRRFDLFIATSREVYDECVACGLERARVQAIPNGVDTDAFAPARSREEKRMLRQTLGLADRPTVCFVGILDARKNVDGVLRIWQIARQRLDAGQIVLVGPNPRDMGDMETRFHRELLDFVRTHGLESDVVFAGQQADVTPYLRCADVFLFPSRREGMPNALLEAMSSGLACVASRVAGASDLLQHGRNGFLFDCTDEAGMGEVVGRLLADPDLAGAVGAKARETIEEKFSLEAIARRYSELYRAVLAERRRGCRA